MPKARESRKILRSLFTPGSEKFCRLRTDLARLLYIGLLLNADDDGAVECSKSSLARMFPWLGELEKHGAKGAKETSSLRNFDRGLVLSRAFSELERVKLVSKSGSDQDICFVNGFAQRQDIQQVKTIESRNSSSVREIPHQDNKHRMDASIRPDGWMEKERGLGEEKTANAEAAYMKAKRRFRNEVNKSLGRLAPCRPAWLAFVVEVGEEIAVGAVEAFARDIRSSGRDFRHPLSVFLRQKEEWIEEAREELTERQAEKPKEELVEWRGMKMTRKEVTRLEREELESQKRKQERERQKPWEPPTVDEGEKVQ